MFLYGGKFTRQSGKCLNRVVNNPGGKNKCLNRVVNPLGSKNKCFYTLVN